MRGDFAIEVRHEAGWLSSQQLLLICSWRVQGLKVRVEKTDRFGGEGDVFTVLGVLTSGNIILLSLGVVCEHHHRSCSWTALEVVPRGQSQASHWDPPASDRWGLLLLGLTWKHFSSAPTFTFTFPTAKSEHFYPKFYFTTQIRKTCKSPTH